MKSRLIAAAAVGTAALAAIAGCSSSSSTAANSGSSTGTGSSNTPVTIDFYGADYGTPGTSNSSTKYWDSVASAFHAANPNITVKVTTIDWTDFLVKAPALIQAHQYPDIMEGEPAPQYAQSDLIYPVSQVVDSSTDSNLVQKFLDDTDYQNTPYGIPWTTSTRAMFYNKKAFAAAGIKAAPTTWAQLQADCPALKAKGYICYGMPLGSEEAQAELLLWFLGNGGGYVNSSGQYAINSPQNIQTLTFMKQLAAAGDTEPSVGTTDRKTVWAEFGDGKIAMCLGSPAVIASDLAPTGTLPLSDVGTAAVPGKTGPLTQTLGVHDDIVVFKNNDSTAKLAAIKEFLDFAYQDKYQLQFDNEYDLLPATQTGATAMSSENPMYAAFLSNISNSVNYPTNTNWGTVDSAIEQQVGAAINGSPSQVLNALQQTASQGG